MGGPAYGGLTDSVFQEIDVKTGLVMYEWTSLDHVALERILRTDRIARATAYPYDFFHLNSISVDRDGSLLISSRNTWTVYKLNPQSGADRVAPGRQALAASRWAPATGTAWQHDPRELPDGAISIVRQRLLAEGARPVARDRREPQPPGGPATLG